jgi:predicted N-acetyltransferase YhbS
MGDVTRHPKVRGGITAPARLNAQIHDVSGFDCGKPSLNEWLQHQAARNEGKTARTYVACEGSKVIGYYCISAGSVSRLDFPSKIKHGLSEPVPVAIIGRLARDLAYRGAGLGGDLLRDALKKILAASQTIGVRAVIVHVLESDAIPFYADHGFKPFPRQERTFYLSVDEIAASL